MNYEAQFTNRIEEFQTKLREANYQANRMKEEVSQFVSQTHQTALERAEAKFEAWKLQFLADSKTTTQETPAPEAETTAAETPEPPAVEAVEEVQPVTRDESIAASESIEIDLTGAVEETPAPETRQRQQTQQRQERQQRTRVKTPSTNSEWERFIGENLLNKIGIAILVIGIGIFVKYAIDKEWIGAVGRVLIGFGSGGLLLGVAHWLRKKYKAFSSVLVGGGMATMYFTTYIAYQHYSIFNQTGAFAIMCGLTALTVVFSILYDRQEIAILGLIGGFTAPFLVSSGEGNYKVLFSYLLVLNAGMLVLAAFREWKLVNILSFIFTVFVFGSWFLMEYAIGGAERPEMMATVLFGSLFFLVFFGMNVVYKARTHEEFGIFEYGILLLNTSLFFIVGILALGEIDGGKFQGLFAVLMAAFHFAFAFPMKYVFKADKNVFLMLLAMGISFLTLAIPIQLDGSAVTMFWAAEAVAILWLSGRIKMDMLFVTGLIVSGLSIASMLVGWEQGYFNTYVFSWEEQALRTPFLNQVFLTTAFVTASLVGVHLLMRMHKDRGTTAESLGAVFFYLTLPVIYAGILLEFIYMGSAVMGSDGVAAVFAGTWSAVYLGLLQAWSMRSGQKALSEIVLIASGILIIATAGIFQPEIAGLRDAAVYSGGSHFGYSYLMYIAIFALLGVNLYRVHKDYGLDSSLGQVFTWLVSAAGVYLASALLVNLLIAAGLTWSLAIKAGLPILWGGIAFVMIWVGLRSKLLHFRLAALALFFITLLKLFIYDIQSVSTGGKIAAFISLGVLLLIISFMYNRIKRLLIEGEN